jgi:hypothetical protein
MHGVYNRTPFSVVYFPAAVCSLPVAKRNFLRRHCHGLVFTAQQLKESLDAVYWCRVIPSTQEATGEEARQRSASIVSDSENEVNDSTQTGSEESINDDHTVKPPYGHFMGFNGSKKRQLLPSVIEAHHALSSLTLRLRKVHPTHPSPN